MRSLRPVTHAMLATCLVAFAGCRTAGVNNLGRQDPLPLRAETNAADLLVDHNRNAERVTSLEAQSAVTMATRTKLGERMFGLSGQLSLERPKNFKLALSTAVATVADIGSNDEEYWFWFKDSPDKAVYYSNYEEAGSNPLATGLQPEWIIEALGLRVVSDDEASRIKVTPGKDPGTFVLTLRQRSSQGDTIYKETLLSESHRIREQTIYAADHKTVLAQAAVTGYQEILAASPEPGVTGERVYVPSQLELKWTQDNATEIKLQVWLNKPKVNVRITPEQREARFVEPKMRGFARINMADRPGMASSDAESPSSSSTRKTPTSVRESLPAPPPRVRLTDPAPLGLDGSTSLTPDPAALSADMMPPAYARGVEEVVGPPIPTIDEPQPQVTDSRPGWRGSLAPGIAR